MSGEYLNGEAPVADGFLVHSMALKRVISFLVQTDHPLSSHMFSFQNIKQHKHIDSPNLHTLTLKMEAACTCRSLSTST
jgi:hypothetical protein